MKIEVLFNPLVLSLLIVLGCQKEHAYDRSIAEAGILSPQEAELKILPQEATIKVIDVEKSIIKWKGTKLMYTRKHEGTVSVREGELLFKEDRLVGGHIISDMRSIHVPDIPAHETYPYTDLINHLNSDFDIQTYPTARFEISKVDYLSSTLLEVTGALRIKDVTKYIVVKASIMELEGTQKQFTTSFTFDRLDWNIGIDGSWLEKKLVDDEIELQISITTK